MPSFFEYTRGKDTIQIAKLEGPRNWDTWRADIQSLLETEGVWEVTTGEDPKPTKPPRPRHTCAPQQQLYRNACEDYMGTHSQKLTPNVPKKCTASPQF